jgi:hypothetical protein
MPKWGNKGNVEHAIISIRQMKRTFQIVELMVFYLGIQMVVAVAAQFEKGKPGGG